MYKKIFFLSVFLLILLFLNCSSYALTDNEFIDFLDKSFELDYYLNLNLDSDQILTVVNQQININDFKYVYLGSGFSSEIVFCFDNLDYHGGYSGRLYYKSGQEVQKYYVVTVRLSDFRTFLSENDYTGTYNQSTSIQFVNTYNICTNYFVFDSNWKDETTIKYNNFEKINQIELISQSNYKFAFNDFNQLIVNLSGDWEISDFSFYIEKLFDDKWQRFTSNSEYYRLINYQNPYYIIWNNINYFSVGQYRYVADYKSLENDVYYSDVFDILQNSVIIDGSGSINDDGDIKIDVDIGNYTDDIKDFLGQDISISEEEFKNQFLDFSNVNDPTSNFFSWVFENIVNVFLNTSNQVFEFNFMNEIFVINSDDIYVPDSFLKTLISLSASFSILYYVILDIHRTFENLKSGNFEEIGNDDVSSNML